MLGERPEGGREAVSSPLCQLRAQKRIRQFRYRLRESNSVERFFGSKRCVTGFQLPCISVCPGANPEYDQSDSTYRSTRLCLFRTLVEPRYLRPQALPAASSPTAPPPPSATVRPYTAGLNPLRSANASARLVGSASVGVSVSKAYLRTLDVVTGVRESPMAVQERKLCNLDNPVAAELRRTQSNQLR